MGLHAPKAGPDYVGEYQISPAPWVTSSYLSGYRCHRFAIDQESPALSSSAGVAYENRVRMTTWVMVKNLSTSSNIQVAFTSYGLCGVVAGTVTSSHNFVVQHGDSVSLTARTNEIWLSGGYACPYSLIAGLNNCDGRDFVLSGSHGDIGVG